MAGENEQESTQEEQQQEEKQPSDFEKFMGEVDRRIADRDKAILGGFEKIAALLASREESRETKREEVKEEPVTQQDFFNDPNAAMQKFFDAKVKPVVERATERQAPNEEVVRTAVEVEKMKLKQNVGDDTWKRYERWFGELEKNVHPMVLTKPGGVDAVWRLAKSYADEAEEREASSRNARNAKANLEKGGAANNNSSKTPELSDEEAKVASAMGISPEEWKKYSVIEEIEVGSNKKGK